MSERERLCGNKSFWVGFVWFEYGSIIKRGSGRKSPFFTERGRFDEPDDELENDDFESLNYSKKKISISVYSSQGGLFRLVNFAYTCILILTFSIEKIRDKTFLKFRSKLENHNSFFCLWFLFNKLWLHIQIHGYRRSKSMYSKCKIRI